MKNRKIFIGADHAGYNLKEELKKYLSYLDFAVEDMGSYRFKAQDDYPDFMFRVAEAISKNPKEYRGIVIGGSGQGEAMATNKVKGIRTAVVYDQYSAKMSREHNDANIMALGAKTMDFKKAKNLVKIWLQTPFSQEKRHQRRLRKIAKMENKLFK